MEFGCLIQLVSSTKINHSTRVTTLHLKQQSTFFTVQVISQPCSTLIHSCFLLLTEKTPELENSGGDGEKNISLQKRLRSISQTSEPGGKKVGTLRCSGRNKASCV